MYSYTHTFIRVTHRIQTRDMTHYLYITDNTCAFSSSRAFFFHIRGSTSAQTSQKSAVQLSSTGNSVPSSLSKNLSPARSWCRFPRRFCIHANNISVRLFHTSLFAYVDLIYRSLFTYIGLFSPVRSLCRLSRRCCIHTKNELVRLFHRSFFVYIDLIYGSLFMSIGLFSCM